MPTAKNEVKLKFGDKAKYASAIKNADTVYFITDTNQIFVGSSLVSSKCYYVTSEPSSSNYGVGDIVVWKISENNAKICIVNSSGEFDILSISIPTELKNPNALTFTGAVTGKYDGSAAKTVNIPAAITVDSSLSATSTNPVQNKAVKAGLDTKINKYGDTMTGDLSFGGTASINELRILTLLNSGDSNGISFTCFQDDTGDGKPAALLMDAVGNENVHLYGLASPVEGDEAVNKAYVDEKIPNATTSDNNKFLRIVNGTPAWVALTNVAEEGA
jgi:hypothetical protein